LTENISQYYNENSCSNLVELYSELIHPDEYKNLEGPEKLIVDYVLENIFALFPQKCWASLETSIDQNFLPSLWRLRMNGALRKYLYFYKHPSFRQNIQFRFIRHGILMNAMVDFVAAATIVKKNVVGMRTIFDNNEFLTKKILLYVHNQDFVKEKDYETKFLKREVELTNYLNYLNSAQSLADYLIKQINNPAWYYIHQHFYKTALLTGFGVGGSIYLLYKYRHKLLKLPEKLPEKLAEKLPEKLPETVKKSWGEWLKEYLPKPWKSTLDVPQPKLENPHG